MAVITSLGKAITKLTLTNIFFTALLYNLKQEATETLPACAATDGLTLFWKPSLFDKFKIDDATFVLAHEVLHVILYHTIRRGARDPMIWNIACDHCVNLMLIDHSFKYSEQSSIPCDTKFRGLGAEQVYDLLIKDGMKPGAKMPGDGAEGEPCPMPGYANNPTGLDIKDYKPGNNSGVPAADMERTIGINLEKALQASKAAGQLTAEQQRALREAQVEREPWHQHLRRYMSVLNTREYNWGRTDQRRMSYTEIVSPEMRTEAMGKIVVSIDESGSLTDEMLSAIGAHVSDICKGCNPKELVIVRHTDRVTHVESYEGPNYDIVLERKSIGGTDFRPVFDLVEAEHNDAQVTLMFTDMYGPMPDSFGGDVLWISSTKGIDVPFGELIEADFND